MSVRGDVQLVSAEWSFEIRERLRDYVQLGKARLSSMVLMSALVGYWLASSELVLGHLLWFAIGTFLVVASANGFNQVVEHESDSRMKRTAERPIPAGRLRRSEALVVASVCSIAGHAILFVEAGPLCGVLALSATVIYVLVYTPMKSRSAWSTVPGAVSGAIPPLMGFSAVQGSLGPLAWSLFAILFFWQFPHTWAIAAAYRDDYAKIGYRAMPIRGTQLRTVAASVLLLLVSLVPAVGGMTGVVYLVGASVLGVLLVVFAARFGDGTARGRAVHLLVASLFYLPLVLALLAFDGKVV
jgi:protoheme IX farnesyltransferase